MRIAYFTDTFLPNADGVVTSIKLLTEQLQKNGHEVYVFCPSGIQETMYIFPIPSKEYQRYPQYKVSFPSFETLTKIREINPDLIHIHTPVTIGLTGLYLGKILNVPTVLTYHTRLDSYMWYIRSQDDDKFIELYTEWLYNQSPVIVPSKSIQFLLRESKVISPIEVIPSPVNLKLTGEKRIHNQVPVILHVGRICREKQIDIILRTFKRALRLNEAKLVITSSGPDEDRLKKYVNDLKLDDNVSFTGYLSTDALSHIYASADIFIAASSTETQGLVVLEAMANGCAVIARKAPGFIDVINDGENGLLFNSEDELVEKMLSLIQDKKMRKRLSHAGYETVERFHPDRLVSQLEKYYLNNLSQAREPTVERFLYAISLMFSFVVYLIVRKFDLPINSRLANVSVDVLKLLLRFAKLLKI